MHKKQADDIHALLHARDPHPTLRMNRPDGLHLLSRIGEIDAARWDALLAASSPTATPGLRHAYLAALEDTGCVGGRTGWTPAHATLWEHG